MQIYPLNLWTGRILRDDKKGHIPDHIPDILARLNIEPRHWVYLAEDSINAFLGIYPSGHLHASNVQNGSRPFCESPFKSLVGSAYKIRQACEEMGKN